MAVGVTGVLEQVARWPVRRVAVGVAAATQTLETYGDVHAVLPWASVTKLLTALTVLMAVEEEIVALDEPAGPRGATVRHLLAHASGLPLDGDQPIARPGERRIYSNTGFEHLAAFVAARTGIPMSDLVDENVLGPLGLRGTSLAGSPAHGAEGPLTDLVALGRQLLAPTLLGRDHARQATTVAFPGLSGVLPGFGPQDPNDWGLGFELRDRKQPHWTGRRNSPATFGHFGRSGSFLWVDPEAGVACAALSDGGFGDWAVQAWPALADAVLARYGT